MKKCRFKAKAVKRGLKKYYTGKPCKNGHDCERFVNGKCVQCSRLADKRHQPKRFKNKKSMERRYKRMKIWLQQEKEKIKSRARSAFQQAVVTGRIIKKPCKVCGSKKVHGHHEDYSKPLKVIWLCPQHHSDRHQQMREK